MVSKHLRPNDQVRVLEDLFEPQSTFLSVTAGSLGRIISFQDYCEYIKNTFDGKDTLEEREKHFSKVAKSIQDESAYIVKIEDFGPASDSAGPSCLEDIVATIPTEYLEKIEG
jgi:hypothetical protein